MRAINEPPIIAQVVVDLDVPHLDRPFDYLVPKRLQASAAVGSLVRVRWGNRRLNGWIVGLSDETEHKGELAPLLRVLSTIPLFSEEMLATYRYLATRYAVNLSQVLSLAIPPRRQKVEEMLGPLGGGASAEAELPQMSEHRSFLPRSVVQVVPHKELDALEKLFEDCWSAGIPLIVLAPTLYLAKVIRKRLEESFPAVNVGFQASELPQTSRYETHLRALRGEYAAVVGTRAAAWTPFRKPAVVAVWDDGSDHYRERRAPRVDALDIAVARVRWEGYGLVAASHSRSVKAQMLVDSGWAASSEPEPQAAREGTPKIRVSDPDSFEREGFASLSTLPEAAFKAVREGLAEGPVLVQVMGVGRFVTLACSSCGVKPRCTACGSVLEGKEAPRSAGLLCDACGTVGSLRHCPSCKAGPLRTLEVGADRVGRELGRAFPSTPVVVSSSTSRIRRRIRAVPQIVVATAGAEPFVRNWYAAVIVLEADRLAYSDRLDAEEEAARRWFNTFSLARPGAPGVLAGEVPDRLRSALVRWRPVALARDLLEERREVGFYPTRWVVGLEGPAQPVRSVLTALESGDYPLEPAEPPLQILGYADVLLEVERDDQPVKAVLSCETRQAMSLMRHLKTLAKQRSLQRCPLVKATVDPTFPQQ